MKNIVLFLLLCSTFFPSSATEPPASGGSLPDAYFQRLASNPLAFTFQRALYSMATRAAIARAIDASPGMPAVTANSPLDKQLGGMFSGFSSPAGFRTIDGGPPTAVSGKRNIAVLALTFSDTATIPYPEKKLQQQLFDGPWPTGTMKQYYSEVSGGLLTVDGNVLPWTKMTKSNEYYVGDDYISKKGVQEHCYGMCTGSRVRELIRTALAKQTQINWGKYDNDGPDGIPNSGDDDGFVDFVAFVQPNIGGECTRTANNIWSHRSFLAVDGAKPFVTNSGRKGGGFILVNDYVIMPALACDGRTMIQIGVFAHEFGHAFGLPDLYDTDSSDGKTAGLGHWCLMASGSWGGDGKSPSVPSQMSPWAKAFLGWIDLRNVDQAIPDL